MKGPLLSMALLAGCAGTVGGPASTVDGDVTSGEPSRPEGRLPDGGAPADARAQVDEDRTPLPPWESLIDPARLHQIDIMVAAADVPALETLHGPDVPCRFVIDGISLKGKGIHQKGGLSHGCRCLALPCKNPTCMGRDTTGKVVPITKPGMTVQFEAVPSADLSGLGQLSLGNGHDDATFLSADLDYELYRRANLPAPHTAYAQVTVNGISEGLYILEESKDKQFFRRNFGSGEGNVYEGVWLDFAVAPAGPPPGDRPDVVMDLKHEKSEGRSREDLYALSNAILGVPDADFEGKISKLIDLDGFITSWAIDAVMNPRDNIEFNLNNYYLYDNPKDNRFVLIPHGADTALVQYPLTLSPYPTPRGYTYPLPGEMWYEAAHGLLDAAVQDIPKLFAKYRKAVETVSNKPLWDPSPGGWMLARVQRLAGILATAKKDGGRMDADVLQFQKRRPEVEAFIKAYGTSRNPEQHPTTWSPVPPAAKRVPVIVTSDLFYPPVKALADDLFDLAILLSTPEVDLKGVVLENALAGKDAQDRPQRVWPGATVMAQFETILRRRTPSYLGLNTPLAGLTDQALGDDEQFQGGVRFILETLRASPTPVTIVTLGSLRDVAAAYNREPALFQQKVGRLLVFAGEAATTLAGQNNKSDYNVELDPFAFAAIMKSGLPIFWAPREDGGRGATPNNAGASSAWTARNDDLFVVPLRGKLNTPPLSYLVNALAAEPARPYDMSFGQAAINTLFSGYGATPTDSIDGAEVRAWSAGATLVAVADKTVTYDGTQAALADGLLQDLSGAAFGFSPVDVTVSERGYVTSYVAGPGSKRVMRFRRVPDQVTYAKAMTQMTGKLLARFVEGGPP